MQMDWNIHLRLQALHQRIRLIWQQQVRHILDADHIRAHLNELFCDLHEIILVVYGADGIADCGLADSAILFRVFDRCFKVAHIVERIENTDYINAVFNRLPAELLHNVIRIMLIAQNVLAAEEHLQLCVRQCLAQFAQAVPWVFVQEAKAAVKRCAAPAFQRPVADAVQQFARRQHIFHAHARCSLRLVRITQDRICNKELFAHKSFSFLQFNQTGKGTRLQRLRFRLRPQHSAPSHA